VWRPVVGLLFGDGVEDVFDFLNFNVVRLFFACYSLGAFP
jgi:hypothetical protein